MEARPNFRLFVGFSDGAEGLVDLSDLVGQGVFSRWVEHPEEFARVRIDRFTGAPVWPGSLEIAPDRLHDEVTTTSASPPTGS